MGTGSSKNTIIPNDNSRIKRTNVQPKQIKQKQPLDEVRLGVVRLDYEYPAALGDVAHPDSFDYAVCYRVVPGLTFEVCQAYNTKVTPEIKDEVDKAIDFLIEQKVHGITGDCGFMMWFQAQARQRAKTNNSKIPVFMSALVQLPCITCGYSLGDEIIILTANGENLKPMKDLIRFECGVVPWDVKYHIVDTGNVPGFEAVALGKKVDKQLAEKGIVDLCEQSLKQHPNVRAFLFECTQLPPFSDAVREATGLPVYDAITCSNFFISGHLDHNRLWGRGHNSRASRFLSKFRRSPGFEDCDGPVEVTT